MVGGPWLFSFGLLLVVGRAQAGPACVHRKWTTVSECVSACKDRWGWPGAAINSDPWGSVVKQVALDADMEEMVRQACTEAMGKGTTPTAVANVGPSALITATPTTSTTSMRTTSSPAARVVPTTIVESSMVVYSVPSALPSSSTPASISSYITELPTISLPENTLTRNIAPVDTSLPSSSAAPSSSPAPEERRPEEPSPTSQEPPTTPTTSSTVPPPPPSSSSPPPSSTDPLPSPTQDSSSFAPTPSPQPTVSSSTAPEPSSAARVGGGPSGGSRTSAADQDAYLTAHNNVRGAHGAQALSWSGELADAAQRWADNCVFEHSGGSLGPFGENLAAGTGAYGPADAVAGWASEGEKFDRSNPEAGGAGHFTQMVWKGTTQLGCAAADCEGIIGSGKARYHVCEYSEPGNVQEQFAQNVQA